jgi:hypothetical protein
MLTFVDETHTYRWNGEVKPSVTAILSRLHDFGMVPADVLAAACERGTAVHQICEYHDLGDLDPGSVAPAYAGYLRAWVNFTKDHRAKWSGIEVQGYSERFGFAGTMDRCGTVMGTDYIVDIKTSAQPHRVWGMQTAAYRQIRASQDPKWLLARRATVQLRADGSYKFLPWDSPSDWPAFMALITLSNWENGQ